MLEKYLRHKKYKQAQFTVRRWTNAAIECFSRGCVCEDCFYNEFFKTAESKKQCQMKFIVLESVRVLGKPESVKEKTIIKE